MPDHTVTLISSKPEAVLLAERVYGRQQRREMLARLSELHANETITAFIKRELDKVEREEREDAE